MQLPIAGNLSFSLPIVSSSLLHATRTINIESLRSLRFLSIRWKDHPIYYWCYTVEVPGLIFSPLLGTLDEQHADLDAELSLLSNSNSNTALTVHTSDPPVPLVSGLAHLALTLASDIFPLRRIYTFPFSNPQLQSLTLRSYAYSFDSTGYRIHLPVLRSLSLCCETESSWAREVIKMIDAPAVERLQLATWFNRKVIVGLVNQLTGDKYQDVVTSFNHGQPIQYKPIYPLLWDLSIKPTRSTVSGDIKYLLAVFPTVTRLFLPGWAVSCLRETPILPNLECISTGRCFALDEVVRCRNEAGFPVKRVEMGISSLRRIKGEWPESVEAVERPTPSCISSADVCYDDYGAYSDDDNVEYQEDIDSL